MDEATVELSRTLYGGTTPLHVTAERCTRSVETAHRSMTTALTLSVPVALAARSGEAGNTMNVATAKLKPVRTAYPFEAR